MAAKRKRNLFDGLLYFLNTLAALALMGAYLANFINPSWISWFAFLGLAYPYLLIANIIFAIWWTLRLKVKIVLPVFAIALGFWLIPYYYKLGSGANVVASGESLKVLTYNVHNLNISNWLEDPEVPQKIKALIEGENPDVVLLQEFARLREEIKIDMPYQYHLIGERAGSSGQLIYSKHPIVDQGYYTLPQPEGSVNKSSKALWVDIQWNNHRIRVMNLHLYSVGLRKEYYEDLEQLSSKKQEQLQEELYEIGGSLKRAFERRAYQVDFLDSLIASEEKPLIVAGDFNDGPCSYTFHQLNKNLEDSYYAAGQGWMGTFNNSPHPLRIDYILFKEERFHCHQHKIIREKLSDHYPVIAEFSLR
jgi:endonuclease/exonuclease/phosphatase family metal-dependent hydrolase